MRKLLIMLMVAAICETAFTKPTESELLGYLQSGDFSKIRMACLKLPDLYPNNAEAVTMIRGMLYSNQVLKVTETKIGTDKKQHIVPVNPIIISRVCARALGDYHVVATDKDINCIYKQLICSHDINTAMDGLKAIRGMAAPSAVPLLVPMLDDNLLDDNGSVHVLRDTIRTLGVIGDASLIPRLEPFTHCWVADIANDAKDAINELKKKPAKNSYVW